MHQFRAAMGIPGSDIGSVEAAVSLGRLLEESEGRLLEESEPEKAKEAFERGVTLSPCMVAKPYNHISNSWSAPTTGTQPPSSTQTVSANFQPRNYGD
jgi:hypothetical protein